VEFQLKDKRIVVLISGSGSNLQAFIDAQSANELGGTVVATVSNIADVYGLERAENAGIQAITIPHKSFDSRESFDSALADKIEALEPDLVILAGFMRILTPEFVNRFAGKMMNIHPSLLPKYPGLHTHKRALENNDEYHGTSVHFVTEELDGGPLIAQSRLRLDSASTEQDVQSSVQKLEHKLYPQVASWFLKERLILEKDGIYFDGEKLEHPILFD